MGFHRDIVTGCIHVIHQFTFANEAARLAYPYVSTDVGKVVRQADTERWFILTDETGPDFLEIGIDLTAFELGGDLDGYLPNPDVVDLTITGEEQGSVLYFDGYNWVQLPPGMDGYVLVTQGNGADPEWRSVESISGGAIVTFTAAGLTSTTTTRYLLAGGGVITAPTVPVAMDIPRGGILKNLRIVHNVPAGNGSDIVYTVRINSIATSVSATLASTDGSGSDITNSAAVSAGDTIDIEVTKAVDVGVSPAGIVAALEID